MRTELYKYKNAKHSVLLHGSALTKRRSKQYVVGSKPVKGVIEKGGYKIDKRKKKTIVWL